MQKNKYAVYTPETKQTILSITLCTILLITSGTFAMWQSPECDRHSLPTAALPLHAVVRTDDNTSHAQALLDCDWYTERRDLEGNTPLASAAHNGSVQTATLLLSRSADIEARNAYGETPLQIAAIAHHKRGALRRYYATHSTSVARTLLGEYAAALEEDDTSLKSEW